MTWLYILAGIGIFWTVLCWFLMVPMFALYIGRVLKQFDEREKRLAEIEAKFKKQDALLDDFERALLDEKQRLKEIRETRLKKKIEENENEGI